jgi:hypothetical protein
MTLNLYHQHKKAIFSLFFIDPKQFPYYNYYSTTINDINDNIINKCISEDKIFRKYIDLALVPHLQLRLNMNDILKTKILIGGNKIKLRAKLYYYLFINNKYYKIYYYFTYLKSKGMKLRQISKNNNTLYYHNYSINIEHIKHEIIYGEPIYFMNKTRNKLLNIHFVF